MNTSFDTAMERKEILRLELKVLKYQHRKLDDTITVLQKKQASDQLMIQRLKKRKLLLKDMISHLEDQITPDIIA